MSVKQVEVNDTNSVSDTGDTPSNVSVDLDGAGQPIQTKKAPEPKYVTVDQLSQTIETALKKATAPLYYELRNKDKQQPQSRPTPQGQGTAGKESIDWDAKLQENWKSTVGDVAEERINQILQKREFEARMEYEKQQNIQLLESNKRKVLDKHKELNDETSKKSDVYRAIIQEHPEYLANPFGPVLAMRDMEDELRDSGYVDEPTKQKIQAEVTRQVRSVASSTPTGSSPQAGKRVVLTKEQKEYCDLNRIKYENFAKYASQINAKGEVAV